MQPFADNLNYLLAHRGLDCDGLVSRLGCNPADLIAWSEGRGEPGLQQLLVLAETFQVSIDRLVKNDLRHRSNAADIKLLVLDVDGVLTDGGIYLTEKGDEIKKFHARDGRGIMTAQKKGIEVAFLSGGVQSLAVQARAERLGVHRFYVGKTEKTTILEQWMAESNLTYAQVAYIGDDANDLGVIAKAGFTACPVDACPKNREAVDLILRLPGGQGCVREFIEEHLGIEID
jgi:3-deoxy-D-manno-octulosonate 8-phosphate phosphatase (KDO 8-P phosphatase)